MYFFGRFALRNSTSQVNFNSMTYFDKMFKNNCGLLCMPCKCPISLVIQNIIFSLNFSSVR